MYKIDSKRCANCGYCAFVCPFKAINHMEKEKYYEIDHNKCQQCGICYDSCIGGFISKDKEDKKITFIKIGDECIGCTTCARFCPVLAITGELKNKHVIDETKCIKCGFCAKKCPKKCIEVKRG